MLSGRGSRSLPDDNQQPQTEMTTGIKQYNSQMIVFCNFVEDHKQEEESKAGWVCASPAALRQRCCFVMTGVRDLPSVI